MQGTHRSDFLINGQSMGTEKALGVYRNTYAHSKNWVMLSYPWRTKKNAHNSKDGYLKQECCKQVKSQEKISWK